MKLLLRCTTQHTTAPGLCALICAAVVGLLGLLAGPRSMASTHPAAQDFAWSATVTPPAGSSVARVALPIEALLRMQSPSASDIRVFNAQGAVVPYALLESAGSYQPTPASYTPHYPAHAVYATRRDSVARPGEVYLRVDGTGAGQSASVRAAVRWDSSGTSQAGAQPMPMVLVDTRKASHSVTALQLDAHLPSNNLVYMQLATSADLKTWVDVPVAGPVFRFDGPDAPSNSTLELAAPLALQGRYLRLSWDGSSGVTLRGVLGRLVTPTAAAATIRAQLPTGTQEGKALVWQLGFGTPIVAVHVQAMQDNTLLPLRIAGRMDASQPWRTLASTVVYRLDGDSGGRHNSAVAIVPVTLRWLRLDPGSEIALAANGLQVSLELRPVELAFVASGPGPYTVAVGREQTANAAVDANALRSAWGGSDNASALSNLPWAALSHVQVKPDHASGLAATGWLSGISARSAGLWAVLVLGVLVLAAVAYALLRQFRSEGTASIKDDT